MVVDAALWAVVAAMIGLVACGCVFTANAGRHDESLHDRFRGA